MYSKLFVSVILVINTLFCFGQTSDSTKVFNNLIGFELGRSYYRFYNVSKFYAHSKDKAKVDNISIKYRRKINARFAINILGAYFSVDRKILTPDKHNWHSGNIDYDYKADFKQKRKYFILMPEIYFGENISFYLKAGIGINFDSFSDFKNGYKVIHGDIKRIKKLPDLNQSRISSGFAVEFGYITSPMLDRVSIGCGIRVYHDTKVKLEKEDIYLFSSYKVIFLGIMFSIF